MTTQNGAPRTARERARAELTREIKEEARRQLAATGADGLSLRAVAKELGMVSSALYRYYPSRDAPLSATGPGRTRRSTRWSTVPRCPATALPRRRSAPRPGCRLRSPASSGTRWPPASSRRRGRGGPGPRYPPARRAPGRSGPPGRGAREGGGGAGGAGRARGCPARRARAGRDRVGAAVRDDQLRVVRPVRRVV